MISYDLLFYCRRILTMEWVTGVKLTTLPAEEVRELVGVGQEAFLVQLLEVGFFHGDPHPGNLLKVRHVMLLCVMSFCYVSRGMFSIKAACSCWRWASSTAIHTPETCSR
jgi:tRNA A-37 threonylcarbamoyl transferase component Bud32